MTSMNRRTFLKSSLAGGVVAVAASAGLLTPTRVLAAAWPTAAFEAKNVNDTLKNLYGTSTTVDGKGVITPKIPIQAEDGSMVRVEVVTSLPNVESVAVLVDGNPSPLVAKADFNGATGYFRTNMKMAKTSNVIVVVKSQGKLHAVSQQVKVTAGGCGG